MTSVARAGQPGRRRVIVSAHLRQRTTGKPDAPDPQHRHVQVDADSYEQGRDQILADLDKDWIVASWRVER